MPAATNFACAPFEISFVMYACAAARFPLALTTAMPYCTFGCAQAGNFRTVTLPGTVRASVE